MTQKSYRQAINEALFDEMRRDPRVVVMGEDICGGAGTGTDGIDRHLVSRVVTRLGIDSADDEQFFPLKLLILAGGDYRSGNLT